MVEFQNAMLAEAEVLSVGEAIEAALADHFIPQARVPSGADQTNGPLAFAPIVG